MVRSLVAIVSLGLLMTATATAFAQADVPEPYVLKPEVRADFKSGKVATVKAFADDKGPLMALDSLSIFQPVSVTVIADDKADDLHVKIGKAGLKDMIFDGTTRGKGVITAKFRSEDEAQLLITSASGRKRFNLVVWVGPIMKPRSQSLLRPIVERN